MLEVKNTIGKYEIVASLPTIGFGTGFKVFNPSARRFEALKIIEKDGAGAQRFLREIQVWKTLNHPNIVSFYGVEEIDGQVVLTCELPEGILLGEGLRNGTIRSTEAIEHIRQSLLGLEHIHAHKITHRCLSPFAFTLTSGGTVKIGDFGFAKSVTDFSITASGFPIGIGPYMAPEQIQQPDTVDHRSDLYSISAILYEAVTGRPPFQGNTFDVWQAQVSKEPLSPRVFNSDLSSRVEHVILKGLSKDPSNRFQSATECRQALEGSLNASVDRRKALRNWRFGTSRIELETNTDSRSILKRLARKRHKVDARLVNISKGGMGVETAEPLERGSIVRIQGQFHSPGLCFDLRAQAKVVYCNGKDDDTYRSGLCFEQIKAVELECRCKARAPQKPGSKQA